MRDAGDPRYRLWWTLYCNFGCNLIARASTNNMSLFDDTSIWTIKRSSRCVIFLLQFCCRSTRAWPSEQRSSPPKEALNTLVESPVNRDRRSQTSEVKNCKSSCGCSADQMRVCLVRTLGAVEFVPPNHAFLILALTLSPSFTCKGVVGRLRRHLQEPRGAAQIVVYLLLLGDEHVKQGASLLRSQKTGTLGLPWEQQPIGYNYTSGRLKAMRVAPDCETEVRCKERARSSGHTNIMSSPNSVRLCL